MNKKAILFISSLAFLTMSLAGCGKKDDGSYTVSWCNYDGSLIEKDLNVAKGTMPSFDSSKPVKADDATSYYVFSGWTPEVSEVKKDITYTATFTQHELINVAEAPDSYVDALPAKTEDGVILHAFCWTFNDIKHNLPYIANAGFKSVQTSPVQTPKGNGSSWWAFYQPLSFSIAEESTLGTKAELVSLCEEAEKYNISIIVDVVFNHMASTDNEALEPDGTPTVSPLVENYEPEIYALRNDATNPTFHHNKNAKGSGSETQYYAFSVLPDLNTAHPLVQERALDFLKECIDAGVDGFRFDAAKHIETPDDPDYPSDFWPNTLGVAKEYYKTKTGKNLYAYGEVLGGCTGRDVSVYTKFMKVTETNYGDAVASGVSNRSAKVSANAKYGKGIDGNNLVTWIESHDTYVTDDNPWSEPFMERAWAILGSRKDTQGLFLARTDEANSVGIISTYHFKSEAIAAVNRLHNRFVGGEEYQSYDGTIYYNERVLGDDKGAVITAFNNETKVVVDFTQLGTGVYYDQITGKSVVVRNGHATIELDSSYVSVLTKSKNQPHPSFDISDRGSAFFQGTTLTITGKNITSGYYQINGGTKVSFEKNVEITLKEEQAVNKLITLKVSVSNSQFTVEEEFYFKTVELIEGYFNVVNVKPEYINDKEIYMWKWGNGQPGSWSKDYTVSGTTLLIDKSIMNYEGFLLAIFEKGYVISKVNEWDSNVIKQSVNISGSILAQGYFDASLF